MFWGFHQLIFNVWTKQRNVNFRVKSHQKHVRLSHLRLPRLSGPDIHKQWRFKWSSPIGVAIMRRGLGEAALVVVRGVVVRTHRLQLAVLPESNNNRWIHCHNLWFTNYTKVLILQYQVARTFLLSWLPGHWVVGGVISVVRVGGHSASLQCYQLQNIVILYSTAYSCKICQKVLGQKWD